VFRFRINFRNNILFQVIGRTEPFEVFTAMKIQDVVFWIIIPCGDMVGFVAASFDIV
jgi:hypothetical protein